MECLQMATDGDERNQGTQVATLNILIGAEARRVYHTAHFKVDQRHEL